MFSPHPTPATSQRTDVSLVDPPQNGSVSGARPMIHGHWGTNTRYALKPFYVGKTQLLFKERVKVFLSALENVRGRESSQHRFARHIQHQCVTMTAFTN